MKTCVYFFFPPNATSECQPLDQCIIQSFKPIFVVLNLNHLMIEYEMWQANERASYTQNPINDHTHLRNVLGWMKSTSDGIEENIIRMCFVKANYLTLVSNIISNQDIDR